MANRTFDRTVLNQRERPLSSDLNQAQSESDETTRRIVDLLSRRRLASANSPNVLESRFFADGFKVNATGPASNNVVLRAGMGLQVNAGDVPLAIGGVLGVNDTYAAKPLILDGDITIGPVPANPGAARIDIVQVKYNRRLEDNTSRDVLDTGTGTFNPTLVNKTLAFILDGTMTSISAVAGTTAIHYKTGVSGSGLPATTDVGYIKVAEINIPAAYAAAALDESVMNDVRRMPGFGGGLRWSHPSAVVGPPTLVSATFQPGVEYAIRRTGAAGTGFGSIYIWGGDSALVGGGAYTVAQSAIMVSQWSTLPFGGVIANAALQALVNGANVSRSRLIAVGQRVFQFDYSVALLSGAATGANDFTAAGHFDFTFE